MCNFLSALVLKSGEVVCSPEHSDSHEDLIDAAELSDNGNGGFARVEYLPRDRYDKLDKYEFVVDEITKPDWFTEEVKQRTIEILKARVSRMIVSDKKKILLGGCYVLTDGADVGKIKNSRILAACDSAKIGEVYGSAKIDRVCDSAKIGEVCGSAKIGEVCGSAKIGEVCDSVKIDRVCDSAKIGEVCGSAKIGRVCGSAKIKNDYRVKKEN